MAKLHRRLDEKVRDPRLGRLGQKARVAVQAREPPVVLVLEVRPVREPQHHHGYQAFRAGPQVSRHVELTRQTRVLRVPDLDAVDADVARIVDTLERQEHAGLVRRPRRRDVDPAAVDPRGVLGGHERRGDWPGVVEVGVDGHAVALGLPVAGDLDLDKVFEFFLVSF